jgi:short-subunit dehydrogenase
MNGEICVVTGATSGIGRATAIGLARKGARVVLVARSQAKATQLVDEISNVGSSSLKSFSPTSGK